MIILGFNLRGRELGRLFRRIYMGVGGYRYCVFLCCRIAGDGQGDVSKEE
jgi:hypothetical protein